MLEKGRLLINEFKSRKVFRAWLFSYLLLLAFSIASGVLLYGFALRYARTEADRSQYQSLAQMVNSVDTVMESISETAFSVMNDSKVKMLKKNENYTAREYGYLQDVNDWLARLQTPNRYLSSIKISFNKSGYLLSDSVWYLPEWSPKTLLDSMGFTLEEWEESTGRRLGNGLYINRKDGQKWLYYMISYSVKGEERPDVSVLAYLNQAVFRKMMEGEESATYLVTQDGNYLASKDGKLPESVLSFVMDSEQPYEILKSKDSYIKKLTSSEYGYSLVHVVSKAGYFSAVDQLRLVLYVYIAVCILFGGMIALYLTKHHYGAVEKLLSCIHRNSAQFPERSEFQAIESFIRRLEQGNIQLNRDRDKKEAALKSSLLSALLKGRNRFAGVEEAEYGRLGRLREDGRYLLAGFEIEGPEDQPDPAQMKEEGWLDILYFMAGNVTEEVFGELCPCYCAEVDGLSVCLIGLPEEEDPEREEALYRKVMEKTELICVFFREKMNTILTGDISRVLYGVEALRQGYGQLREIVRFRDWVGTKRQVLGMDDLEQWMEEEEQQEYLLYRSISELLEDRKFDAIRARLDEAGMGNGNETGDRAVVETVAEAGDRAVAETGDEAGAEKAETGGIPGENQDAKNRNKIGKDMENGRRGPSETPSGAGGEMVGGMEAGPGSGRKDISGTNNPDGREPETATPSAAPNAVGNAVLAEQIRGYMEQQFTNPELNVNRLADQFAVSQSNLSQIFKRYYGMGPLEYIHRLRLKLAKEYLAGSDSVQQVAERVGYYSTRPLIRCFKQYEGKTPSEYRDEIRRR